MKSERIVPADTALTHPFFEGAAAGELRIQSCVPCGHRWFPPSTSCSKCLSKDITWAAVSGRGTVWSWTVMHRPYMAAFKDELPYVVAFVQLEEGPLMMIGVTDDTVPLLAHDLPVEATFETFGADTPMPMFRASATAAAR